MSNKIDIENIDPNAKHCPLSDDCGEIMWRGNHASSQHPEMWEEFKEVYEPRTVSRTVYVRRDRDYRCTVEDVRIIEVSD